MLLFLAARGGASLSNINLGQAMRSLTLGRPLDPYTGVIIRCGQDSNGEEVTFAAGNLTGYVLEIDNPLGTQEMAYAIIAALRNRGVRYRPFEAASAILDPAAEIGDNVTVNGTESVILSMVTKHSRLMVADISAPYDEEVDHEFTYVPRTQREFKRESAYARSRITQNENQIQLEVARATAAEGTLSSRITLEADRITSEVARATAAEGTLRTSIEQRLDSIKLSVSSASGTSVFELKDGTTTLDTQTLDLSVKAVNVSGKLKASQIEVGEIEIGAAQITSGTIATARIPDLSADKITSGTINAETINVTNLNASNLARGTLPVDRIGATSIGGGKLINNTLTTAQMASGINTNLGYGAAYGAATVEGTSSYPSWFRAGTVVAGTCRVTTLFFGTTQLRLLTKTIGGQEIHYMGY